MTSAVVVVGVGVGAFVVLQALIYSAIEDRPLLDGFHWALQTISSVGYGDCSPRSALGRVFAVITATMGIVWMGAFTIVVGRVLSVRTAFVAVLIISLACGAALVALEGWPPNVAAYYVVISLLTVGYGDVTVSTAGGKVVSMLLCVAAAIPTALLLGAMQNAAVGYLAPASAPLTSARKRAKRSD